MLPVRRRYPPTRHLAASVRPISGKRLHQNHAKTPFATSSASHSHSYDLNLSRYYYPSQMYHEHLSQQKFLQEPRSMHFFVPPVSNRRQTPIKSSASHRPRSPTMRLSAIPYFAYFSNLNPAVLGPRSRIALRRVDVLKSTTATLPDHRLIFNVPSPLPGAAFANLTPAPGQQVKGAVIWLRRADFRLLALSEGCPFPDAPPLPFSARVQTLNVVLDDDATIEAQTFVWDVPFPSLRPSRRYKALAVEGALYHGIDPSYRDYLAKLQCAPFG